MTLHTILIVGCLSQAASPPAGKPAAAAKPSSPAKEKPWEAIPRNRDYPWMTTAGWRALHAEHVARARRGDGDLLFVGDSITQGWLGTAIWRTRFANRTANIGIGGDTTQNVLWRLDHGAVDGLKPKHVVVMIGTNNFGLHQDTPEDVARGVTAIVEKLRGKLPEAKILLVGIFPRDEKPDAPSRGRIRKVNETLAKLADGKSIRFLDLTPELLEPDGRIARDLMPDYLHLSEKGYRLWASAITGYLTGADR
jgi:lysophospholipase L1-like esterase